MSDAGKNLKPHEGYYIPLAQKVRPRKLNDFIGQQHLVGKNGPICQLLEHGQVFSMIFWGPPGCGKTTLARIIANQARVDFIEYSAVTAKKNDVIRVVKQARENLKFKNKSTILFIDEIHRFNKAQQDAFLPYVEDGSIILIGATTENPSFKVISPLLSRCQVYVFNSLSHQEIKKIINRALTFLPEKKSVYKHRPVIAPKALDFLARLANGDARVALNILELAVKLCLARVRSDSSNSPQPTPRSNVFKITSKLITSVIKNPYLRYDRAGDEHYNTISAFIKSMRASQVDASLYYLARMVEAGEDPLFIARRMVIFASEDIGMALPTALVVANEVFRACETIGYPECAINLAQGAVYLAQAPKDRSSYNALRSAQADVRRFGSLPIPLDLRNPVTKLMEGFGYGKGYDMYPDKTKSLLPEKLKGKKYYHRKDN